MNSKFATASESTMNASEATTTNAKTTTTTNASATATTTNVTNSTTTNANANATTNATNVTNTTTNANANASATTNATNVTSETTNEATATKLFTNVMIFVAIDHEHVIVMNDSKKKLVNELSFANRNMLIRKEVEHHANEKFDDDYSNHDRVFRFFSRSFRDDQERSQHQLKSIRQ
jgi:cell wall-associated NlpC family hydrolase